VPSTTSPVTSPAADVRRTSVSSAPCVDTVTAESIGTAAGSVKLVVSRTGAGFSAATTSEPDRPVSPGSTEPSAPSPDPD